MGFRVFRFYTVCIWSYRLRVVQGVTGILCVFFGQGVCRVVIQCYRLVVGLGFKFPAVSVFLTE